MEPSTSTTTTAIIGEGHLTHHKNRRQRNAANLKKRQGEARLQAEASTDVVMPDFEFINAEWMDSSAALPEELDEPVRELTWEEQHLLYQNWLMPYIEHAQTLRVHIGSDEGDPIQIALAMAQIEAMQEVRREIERLRDDLERRAESARYT
jgi:AmiR/NasT family two-component response regulator